MPMIIPIKELKNTSTISDMCHNADEPIFIIQTSHIQKLETPHSITRFSRLKYNLTLSYAL